MDEGAGPRRHGRHWSLAEANALRPLVAACVHRLRDARASLDEEAALRVATPECEALGGAWPGERHARATVEILVCELQLEGLEIQVRDLERGLVDFPALRGGEEVYLCWLVDEPEIGWWHHPDAGFGGRRPL
jgi:hypothetical protein